MSPKYSSLAFDELKEESYALESEAFIPELRLVSRKQFSDDLQGSIAHRPIAIRGTLKVSF